MEWSVVRLSPACRPVRARFGSFCFFLGLSRQNELIIYQTDTSSRAGFSGDGPWRSCGPQYSSSRLEISLGDICQGRHVGACRSMLERYVWERTYMRTTAGEASILVWKACG